MFLSTRLRLMSLTERIVLDCQALVRAGGGGNTPPPKLGKQITKFIPEFTPKQLALTLSAVSKLDIGVDKRRLVHQLSGRLSEDSVLSGLSLRDLALVVNALSRLGIRNEVFLSSAQPRIERKLRGAVGGKLDISATALVLDGITKLGFIGDGSLVPAAVKALLAVLIDGEAVVKEIDAVTILRAFVRLSTGDAVLCGNSLGELIPLLLRPVERVEAMVAALTSIGKLGDGVTISSQGEIDRMVLAIKTFPLLEMTDPLLVQSVYAVSMFPITANKDWFKLVFRELESRIAEGTFLSTVRHKPSILVLLLSSMARVSECVGTETTVQLIQKLEESDTLTSTSLGTIGIVVLVNLCSVINLPLPAPVRTLLKEDVFTNPAGLVDGHSFSVLVNALAKLDEPELIWELCSHVSLDQVVRTLSDQSVEVSLLAILSVLDVYPHNPTLLQWSKELLRLLRQRDQACVQSQSQVKIIHGILSTNPAIANGVGYTQPLQTRGSGEDNGPPEMVGVVSNFHRDVIDSITSVLPPRAEVSKNQIHPILGYEVDILIIHHDQSRVSPS